MKKKTSILALLSCFALGTLGGCNYLDPSVAFESKDVEIVYKDPELVSLEKPTDINSMDEFSYFLDYSVFNGKENEFIYTTVTDSYKETLLSNLDEESRWAGQYGALSHNFLSQWDFSRLESENLVGASGYFFEYGTMKNEVNHYNYDVYDYSYYKDVLSEDYDRGYEFNDFYLTKNNKGYLKVDNSEQLFFAVMNGYMPYIENNEELESLLSKALGILNRIIKEDMSQLEKYEAIYNYLTNTVKYDYKMLNNKEGNPRLYRCYYLEGSIMDGLATCDGLTKAMTLLAKFEGIDTYHVGAVGYRGGHAYNYSKVDDNWYLSCTTNGSKKVNYKQNLYLNHTHLYFLTNDTPTPDWDFQSESYKEIGEQVKNVTKYDYWSNKKLYLNNKEYSLNIEDKETGIELLEAIDKVAYDNKVSLDIEILCDFEVAREINNEAKFKCDTQVNNNGMFNSNKLYSYVFLGGQVR